MRWDGIEKGVHIILGLAGDNMVYRLGYED